MNLALTGFNVLLGSELTDVTYVSGGFFGLIMVLVLAPIYLIVCNYVNQLANIKKLIIFLAPLAGLIATFFAEGSIAFGLNVSASASMGYYLYLIISIAMIAVGFQQYQNIFMSKGGLF